MLGMFATIKKRQKPFELKAAVSQPGNLKETAFGVHLCNRLFTDGSNPGHRYVLTSASLDRNLL